MIGRGIFTQVIGRRGAVIAQVIPELEWIIGKQQPADELFSKEAENRFLMVFRDFVKVFRKQGSIRLLYLLTICSGLIIPR